METLRRAVEQAAQHGLIPPPQRGALQAGFERWDAAGRPPEDPQAFLNGLGLAPQEVEQVLAWRAACATDTGSRGGSSSLIRYLRAGPLAKAERVVGARLGPYVVEQELARGGMGVVFVARHEPSGTKVALKTMILGANASEESRARFTREAETAGRLDHPGLVKVLGAGEEEGLAWLAMEFVEGTTLEEALDAPGSKRQKVKLLLAAARALEHAHANGVVHRDIKPQNILVDTRDRVVVTDFGLVRDLEASSELTKTGQALGTPYFMAPEQVIGDHPTPATDVYALGVILYRLLGGQLPFTGELGLALFAAIRNEEPVALETLDPDVSPGLASICRMAMAKAPAARYPTAGALADDLEAWLAGEGGGEARARGPLVPLLVVGVLVLVAVLGLLIRRGQQAPETASAPSGSPAPSEPPGPSPGLPSPTAPATPSASASPSPTPDATRPAGGSGVDRAEAIRRADALLDGIRGRASDAEALAVAEQAVAAAPFYGRARWYRGRILAARKEPERALADLRAADTVKVPFNGPGLFALRGDLLYGARAFKAALPDLERTVRRRPRDVNLAVRFGLCLRYAGEHERSVQVLESIARALGPKVGWQVRYNLGGCYMKLERYAKAEENYLWVIQRLDYVHAYRSLGFVYRKWGKPEKADALLSKAAGRHGRNARFVLEWTLARLACKRWRGAETLARKAVALKPDGLSAHIALARALAGQGRTAEAITVLEQAPPKVRDHERAREVRRELEAR